MIAYITATKENTPLEYWSSRLSRFSSLVIPVVFLTWGLDAAGTQLNPETYAGRNTMDMPVARILISLAYLNQIWTLSIMSFSNVPYWSVCYEMWYYAFFAILTFTQGRTRLVLASLCAALVGPKILLLAPPWMLGVVLYRWHRLQQLKNWQYWTLFILSWPLYALHHLSGITEQTHQWLLAVGGAQLEKYLGYSHYFLTDYLLALIVAANFVGARGVAHHFSRPLLAGEKIIRKLSAYTFSIYLLHLPLLLFFMAAINGDPRDDTFLLQVLLLTFASIMLISTVTEQRRAALRPRFHQALQLMFNGRKGALSQQ